MVSWLLAAALAAAAGGCASEDDATSSPPRDGASSLLIDRAVLPSAARSTDGPPEVCGPIPVLKSHGADVALSPTFDLQGATVVEAVGIEASAARAGEALEALERPKRMVCIGNVIASLGPQEGPFVKLTRPEEAALGDEGSVVRFREVDRDSRLLNSTHVVSFRSGRCVASLLFLVEGAAERRQLVGSIAIGAADRLRSERCR